MKKPAFLFLVALLAISINATCQTFYYVGGIQIIPTNPTTADIIKVKLFGNFASTGSYIVNHDININNFQVNLTINCNDQGGLTVIVPHDTAFTIGMLPAGTYTINLSGIGIGDYAPAIDKTFVVTSPSVIEENNLIKPSFIYPNPCTNYISVKNNKSSDFELYNYNGALILEKKIANNGIIDLTDMEHGIYFIKIITDNGIECQKIIKQ
ncbi:MAG: T9SS type A sorting domain-containing protein [Bacteroidia bacterium]|nr:T9SS type A sorting domain-containing protein [Bacteroidia bacterium]